MTTRIMPFATGGPRSVRDLLVIFLGQSNTGDGNGLLNTDLPGYANPGTPDAGIQIFNGTSFVTMHNGVNNNILGGLGQGTVNGLDNSKTWGPEVEWTYRFRQDNPSTTINVVKCVWGGTPIDNYWGTAAAGSYPFWEPPPNNTGNTGPGGAALTGISLWSWSRQIILAAKAKLRRPKVLVVNIMQGETDAANFADNSVANRYSTNLPNWLTAIRGGDIATSTTPIVLGRIANNGGVWQYASTIQAVQDSLGMVPTNGITTVKTDSYPIQTGNYHYTATGQGYLGRDMYLAYKGTYVYA
jgi:Carbohydrate esterase, sialic acid-specific acetylesterase